MNHMSPGKGGPAVVPRRIVAYMAGISTPFFLGILKQLLAQQPGIESIHYLIGDRLHYEEASRERLDPRLTLIYQHEGFDPFQAPRPDLKRLSDLESRYGLPNLWRYILTHPMIARWSHAKQVAYLAAYLEYFESLCERLRPDVFIVGGQDSLPFIAANEVFKRNGCMSLVITPGWIPGYVFVIDNEMVQIPGLRETYEQLKGQALAEDERLLATQIREQYQVKRIRPVVFSVGHGVSVVPSPIRLASTLWRRWRYHDRYFDVSLAENMRRSVLVRARYPWQRLSERRQAVAFPTEERSFYYPLSTEPEASVDVLGTVYRDQFGAIEQVARALPAGHVLYVKEHPNMFAGARPLGYFRRLNKLGNVRVLDRRIDGHDVIKRCKGVITIAGTSGFEALFYGKPTLLLGRTFYETFREGVFRANGMEDMASKLMHMAAFPGFDPELLDRFVVAVIRRSYPGLSEMPAKGLTDESNLAVLAAALVAEMAYRQGMALRRECFSV